MTHFLGISLTRSYLQSSFSLLLFFASWGIWWSFFQIWLTSEENGLGLGGTSVGIVYAANSLATLFFMIFYGTLQDRLGARRHLAILAAGAASLVGPFMIWIYRPLLENSFALGVTVGAIFLSAGFLAAFALFEAIAERISRRSGFEYGQARMWGSAGYAVVALLAGFLFTLDARLIFWMGSLFGVALLLMLIVWKAPVEAQSPTEHEQQVPSLSDMLAVFKIGALWKLIIFVFFSWTFYTVYDQQMFPEFYTRLFDSPARGQQYYGMLNSAQVFLEAAMMGLVPLLMHRIGVRNTILLGALVMFLRILGSAVFEDPMLISLVKMFHAIEVPLFVLAIFRYFTLHFNPALSATLYLVGFQISAQGGNIVLSPLLGMLRDSVGYQTTFSIISAIVFIAGLYAFFVLKRDNEDVYGEPFVSDTATAQPA
ncbi:galactoside permease [Kushneria pakistanensis]|uniref:Galactoside permease n=1 Tax=Kushneria pakistanensis TaxID=1508770 RepID=A0ABQ3FBJ1_9GAMM|nr:oligosaccharide MFS transporter [Kushneria pakistanensis]GHC17026.1 galactoside permease [Kushneria pakistanensis]